jgi:hypothetical protein
MDWAQGISSFSYCMEMFLACFLYMIFLEKRENFWLRVLMSCCGLFLAALFIHPFFMDVSTGYVGMWFLIIYLVMVLIGVFCCQISWMDAIYCASCGYATQHFASSVYILLWYQGEAPEWSGYTYYLIYFLVYLLFYLLFARNLPEEGHYNSNAATSFAMGFFVLVIALLLSMRTKQAVDMTGTDLLASSRITLFRSCQVYAILGCFFLLWLQRIQRNEIRTSRQLQKNEMLWKQRQMQYQMSKDNIELINHKCHDLRHQIAALSLEKGSSSRKQEFIREIQDMVEVYDSNTDTGNEALDTILMEKGLYCKLHGIQWTCVADGKILDFMDVVDLYTLLGNAIDNAIESVEQLENPQQKIISVKIWQRASFAVIQIENYCDKPLVLKDGLPITSKWDTDNHGFGLKSMRKIAEKYQGTLSVKTENNTFLLYTLLPCE